MAEVVLRDQLGQAGLAGSVTVDSAGTGDWHIGAPMHSGSRRQLARNGYDGESHRARQFEPSWLPERDLVLAMDAANLRDLRATREAELAGIDETEHAETAYDQGRFATHHTAFAAASDQHGRTGTARPPAALPAVMRHP